MPDDVVTEDLQDLPCHRGCDGAQPQVAPGHLARRGEPESQPEQPDVEHQGNRDRTDMPVRTRDRMPDAAGDPGQDEGDDLAEPDDEDEADAAQEGPGEAGPPREGHLPDRVERVLRGAGHAARAEKGSDQADDQCDAGLVQRMHVRSQLGTDHRVLRERGLEHMLPQDGIVAEGDVKHCGQHEQQGEDRREGVVGEPGRRDSLPGHHRTSARPRAGTRASADVAGTCRRSGAACPLGS